MTSQVINDDSQNLSDNICDFRSILLTDTQLGALKTITVIQRTERILISKPKRKNITISFKMIEVKSEYFSACDNKNAKIESQFLHFEAQHIRGC